MVCYRIAIKRGWKSHMSFKHLFLAATAAAILATPVGAQLGTGTGYDGHKFVAAVRERDGNKALELLQARGPTILNARDEKGETALTVAIARRDDTWSFFLLQQGADPNIAARNGDTPLITAARIGFDDVAGELIRRKAKVDAANRMGETALIVAVQARHVPLVKRLLAAGANPDKTDSAAGYSARDYAKRDTRSREILKLIEAKSPPKA